MLERRVVLAAGAGVAVMAATALLWYSNLTSHTPVSNPANERHTVKAHTKNVDVVAPPSAADIPLGNPSPGVAPAPPAPASAPTDFALEQMREALDEKVQATLNTIGLLEPRLHEVITYPPLQHKLQELYQQLGEHVQNQHSRGHRPNRGQEPVQRR